MNPQPNPEILKELKAYVFALYIGSNCRSVQGELEVMPPYKVNGAIILNIEQGAYPDAYLELRSLSTITDSECREVATHYNWAGQTKDHFDERVLQFKIDLPCIAIGGYQHRHLYWVFDYLRQQSFALPIFYKGVQYSVEELCEFGIYSIKK